MKDGYFLSLWRLGYKLGKKDIWIRFPAGSNDVALFHSALGPTQLFINRYRRVSPGIKRPGLEADHSPPSNAQIKNARSCTSTPRTSSCCFLLEHKDNFTFTCRIAERMYCDQLWWAVWTMCIKRTHRLCEKSYLSVPQHLSDRESRDGFWCNLEWRLCHCRTPQNCTF
jgi:hypothetical protein